MGFEEISVGKCRRSNLFSREGFEQTVPCESVETKFVSAKGVTPREA